MVFFVLVLSMAVLVSAQGIKPSAPNDQQNKEIPQKEIPHRGERENAAAVTVSGTLTLVRGMIAVEYDGITYLMPSLMRYTGFIESLKDGAQAKIEGVAFSRDTDAKTKILLPGKMTIGNKEYDLGHPRAAAQARRNFGGFAPQWQGPGSRGPQRQGGYNQQQRPGGRTDQGQGQCGCCQCGGQQQRNYRNR